MTLRNCLSGLLLLFLLATPASEASLLSRQYTSSWISSDFFPLGTPLFRISNVLNETGHDASFDIFSYLSDQIRQQLSASGLKEDSSDNANAVVVELSVHLYQEGSTFGRWLGGGAGVAYAVVQATFHKRGQSTGAELLTVSVIGEGGLFSAGAEKTVLEDTASVIASFLKEGGKK
jgi:ribulose 1,5-bisphosphate synthetase/thiazole synthase